MSCRACGIELLENARFCHGCGAPVARPETRAEYKQVTVVFADVVHSMDIAAAVGAERLREIMAELVERSARVVERYGGTVDKFTGDGIMAVFGAPIALEDHAVRACYAALAIQQQAMQLAAEVKRRDGLDFALRVGLDSGEVIAGEVASSAGGYTAVGEHVGLAQRMESAAPPGGVLLSESTARLLEHTAVLGDPESVLVKGIDEPVLARRLLGMHSPHAGARPGDAPLVGRGWEIAAIEANLQRSVDGYGSAVALVGPPGIGKSRLVRETATKATSHGADVFWAFCESHTSDIPFHAVVQLLQAVVGLPALSHEAARNRLRDRLRDADEDDIALFEDLIGVRSPTAALPKIDPDARQRRLSALVKAAAVARETPALYIVEDVHWIDDASDAMLADLLTVIPQARAMVLITHRTEFHGALSRVPGAQTLTLAPLSNTDTVELARELLGPDPSVDELIGTVTARSAGNPFFTQEIVRDLVERGVLVGERGAYRCPQGGAEVSVPATLQATIAARIDRLHPPAKRTLGAAAVIGMRFDTELLSSMGVDPIVDELLQAELIDQVTFTRHPEYAFRHPLIRTVAYESQLKADRTAMHRKLAAAIESRDTSADRNAALIAEHFESAGDLRPAYGWHMRSAAWSQSRNIAASMTSWERASRVADELPVDDEERLNLQIAPRTMLCANSFRIRNRNLAAEFQELQDLCDQAGDKRSMAIASVGSIGEDLIEGRAAHAARTANELLTLVESIGDPTLTVGVGVIVTAVKMVVGEIGEVLPWVDTLIDQADGDQTMGDYVIGSPLAWAYAIRSTARWWVGLPGWREDFDRAIEMAKDADPISKAAVMTHTYYNGIGCGVVVADAEAFRNIDEALQSAEQASDDIALALALLTKSNALHQDPTQREHGNELLMQVREMICEGRYYRTMLPVIDARDAEVRLWRGDRDALSQLRASLDDLYTTRVLGFCPWATELLVGALLEGGATADVEKAIPEADAAVERLSTHPVLDGSVIRDLALLRCRALLARARGDAAAYRERATRYRDLATTLGCEGHIKTAAAMLGTGL
ncbi:cyclase [Mycolicibacterium agri]|uniref:Cyclase n=1 Tax=Mycolicibacterium agri TaxID=36811 RepID=A0A2A7MQA1_MYCAG|nr:adenylate/guanylate cyclase domain-containing protein [Mycolicibacterium agri]PEG33683.1 cyclase [Mycolicibacterium agri]GFG55178.1 cyclase [Mycolicibacterium agri]